MLTSIVGTNWGDEGKGRMVDLLSEKYDIVVRYQGGNNAGHTVVNEKGKFVLNLMPSGILRDETVNVLGPGIVIDLEHLYGEAQRLREGGIEISPEHLKISDRKIAYCISLVLGGIGFIMIPFIHNQYVLFVPYLLIGCAWAAMLALPFAIVTNALEGHGHMGVYLGLFNGTICIPQIVAAATGGVVFQLIGGRQCDMLMVAGILLVIGAFCVFVIKDRTLKQVEKANPSKDLLDIK